jgi:mannosyltransferase OCH1-like enzyme
MPQSDKKGVRAMRKQMCYIVLLLSTHRTLLSESGILNSWPDFDRSLGKGDPYFDKYYRQCFASLKEPSTKWGSLEASSSKELYDLINACRRIYESNKVDTSSVTGTTRIPLIVHQIWLGSPFPEKYKHWQKTWQSIPGWKYKLWTDEDIKKLKLVNKDLYEMSKNYGQRSDIARVEILNTFGGLYVDVDFECVNPQFFTMLNKAYDFYAGIEPLDVHKFSINNALMASVPGHPILNGYIKDVRSRWHTPVVTQKRKKTQQGVPFSKQIVGMTGPVFFTSIVKKYVGTGYKDIVLPPTFFYPLARHYRQFLGKHVPEKKLKKAILKPESVAIHWWGGSWKQPAAFIKKSE